MLEPAQVIASPFLYIHISHKNVDKGETNMAHQTRNSMARVAGEPARAGHVTVKPAPGKPCESA